MCGIVGITGYGDSLLVREMADKIYHRGPDSEGFYDNFEHKIFIGMRRLSIIDISGGDQPFSDPSGRVKLVYNGEIYNFLELRRELESYGFCFRTNCDTEVVLNAYLYWGSEAWSRLNGMFSICLVDLRGECPNILLVRDRVGMKPLYYSLVNGRLAFASEVKALRVIKDVGSDINVNAISSYLRHRFVAGSQTMFDDVLKLPPGSELVFSSRDGCTITKWWEEPVRNDKQKFDSLSDAADYFGNALSNSVRRHMIADVPVGSYLSGGIDSNTITALMAEFSDKPIHTFTMGFEGYGNDDVKLAKITSNHLGTIHHNLECNSSDMASLPDIVRSLDEPIGDPIIVPLFKLSSQAAESVKVVLAGEGADEILGGYLFQRKMSQLLRVRDLISRHAFRLIAKGISATPLFFLQRLFDYPGELGRTGRKKVSDLMNSLAFMTTEQLFSESISLYSQREFRSFTHSKLHSSSYTPAPRGGKLTTHFQDQISFSLESWLPDDILLMADKLTMANSIEGRSPFLDQEVINAAYNLQDKYKYGAGGNKLCLREFAKKILPKKIIEAPKRAFYIPVEEYTQQKELKEIYEHSLNDERIKRRGLVDVNWIKSQKDLLGKKDFMAQKRMFSIAMLELWFDENSPNWSAGDL